MRRIDGEELSKYCLIRTVNSRYAKVRFPAVSSVARWRPKSPADVRQESDGVCSDFGADNTLGFLRNHQQLRWETIACVAISEGSLCFFLSRRERRRKLSLEQRHESPLCVTSAVNKNIGVVDEVLIT